MKECEPNRTLREDLLERTQWLTIYTLCILPNRLEQVTAIIDSVTGDQEE
jgi:hypothetical protein